MPRTAGIYQFPPETRARRHVELAETLARDVAESGLSENPGAVERTARRIARHCAASSRLFRAILRSERTGPAPLYSAAERLASALGDISGPDSEEVSYTSRRASAEYLLGAMVDGIGSEDRIGLPGGAYLRLIRPPAR